MAARVQAASKFSRQRLSTTEGGYETFIDPASPARAKCNFVGAESISLICPGEDEALQYVRGDSRIRRLHGQYKLVGADT